MSVYIKGMEMPKNGHITITISDDGEVVCNSEVIDGKYQYRSYGRIGKAIPVPPHGDLIDRGEAIIDANERAYDFWLSDDEVNASIQFLKEQTTIIPAERREKDD